MKRILWHGLSDRCSRVSVTMMAMTVLLLVSSTDAFTAYRSVATPLTLLSSTTQESYSVAEQETLVSPPEETLVSFPEDDTLVSLSEEDTLVSLSEEDTLVSFPEEDTKEKEFVLTSEHFVSDDPVEQRLLPLLKAMHESKCKKVAVWAPHHYRMLLTNKPVRTTWANQVVKSWKAHPSARQQALHAQNILETLLDLCQQGYPEMAPNHETYANAVSAWVRHATDTGDARSMERAQQLVHDMWTTNVDRPGTNLYQKLFWGWMKLSFDQDEYYKHALSILTEMKELRREGFDEYKPDYHFRLGLKPIWPHLKSCKADKVPLLETIVREFEASESGKRPKAMAGVRKELITRYLAGDAPIETTVLPMLHEWREECRNHPDPFVRLNTVHMNQFITATKQSQDAFLRSKALLQEMWKIYGETNDESIKPDSITYSSLIYTLPNVEDAGGSAQKLLQEMWHLYNTDRTTNKALKPNAITYGGVMQAWSKSGHKDAGDQTTRLLRDMWARYHNGEKDIKPLGRHYIYAISATSAVKGAQGLLREMWKRYKKMGNDESIKPSTATYHAVMDVMSKCNTQDAGESAHELLEEMWDLYKSNEEEVTKPNASTYLKVMQLCSISTHMRRIASDRAEGLLRDMWSAFDNGDLEMKPSKGHYNHVLTCLGNLGGRNGVNRAEALFHEMWNIYRRTANEDMKPDLATYQSMQRILARVNKTKRAKELLQNMWEKYEQIPAETMQV